MTIAHASAGTSRGGATTALVAGVVGTLCSVWFSVRTETGQRIDEHAMDTVVAGRDAQIWLLNWLGRVSIGAIAAVAVVCVVVALTRRDVSAAVGALVVIAGANITTQLLKHEVITRPDFGMGTLNSLPSGHTTVVASGAAALALVVPRLMTVPVVLAGTFATSLTATSTVVAGWHRPSDVVAACAVTLAWTGLAGTVISRRGRGTGVVLPGALAATVGAVVCLVVIGVRPIHGMAGFLEAGLVLGTVAAVVVLWSVLTFRLIR